MLFRSMGQLGLLGICIPERYGGAGLDYISLGLVCEELEAMDTSLRVVMSVHVGLNSMGIYQWGTEEQKQRILPKLISLEWKSSMALTEPNAGSDLGKLRTSAKREGDQYIINGSKIFITGGSGDVTFALVRTAPESKGLEGLSVLIVPRKIDGRDNYRVTKIEDKICLHASPTCEIVFENSVGELLGPEDAQQWEWLLSGYISTGPRIRWRLLGAYFQIWPGMSTSEYLGFEYRSKGWANAADGTVKNSFTADTDTCIYPDRLMVNATKLKYFEAKGFDTTAMMRNYLMEMEAAKALDMSSAKDRRAQV